MNAITEQNEEERSKIINLKLEELGEKNRKELLNKNKLDFMKQK